tara:strand:+ start:9717 stop:12020 length:2304 start_codon:yes stop_codon:yes gene_type:complete
MALGDKDYNVEFDDSLLSLRGWTCPRWKGSSLTSLYYNEFTTGGDHIVQIGSYQNANLETRMRWRLPETRYATGVTFDSYGWWMNRYKYLNVDDLSAGFGDPTIGVQGSAGHAFSDGANTKGMGPKTHTGSHPTFNPNTNITYSGIVKLDEEKEYDLVPTFPYEGDDTYSVMPTIQNTTNTIFVGTKVLGFKEDQLYPGPGPDFSYLIINKAVTFNTDDDSFFIIENETDDDPTFEKLVQTNLPWSSKFKFRLLDEDQPNNLKKSYGVHYNRGLFAWIARYTAPYNTSFGDYQDENGQWVRSYHSIFRARHDYCNLTTAVYLAESASNRYQIGYPGTPPRSFANKWGTYYGFAITGSQNLISGSEKFQLGGAPPVEHTHNPLLRFTRTQFEWVNRFESSEQGLGTNMDNITGSYTTAHRGGQLSGSLVINKDNPAIQWWFKEGGRKTIRYMNPVLSQSQNIKPQSFRRFIERLRDNPTDKLYALTINDALNCDHTFKMAVEGSLPPGNSPTQSINSAQSNFFGARIFSKVSKPLVTFGTFPFDGSKVGVPGCSPNAFQWKNNYASNRMPPNITIPEGYAPQYLNYVQLPTKVNDSGDRDGQHGTTTGVYWEKTWWGTTAYWVGNRYTSTLTRISNAASGLTNLYDIFTGSLEDQELIIEAADDEGYPDSPFCDNWVITCLEERNNIILTNLNKKIDLSSGVGKKGFAIISEDLNPEIRNNLDYYLKKAQLITSGPDRKDKNLIKHKPKPGFFKKRDGFGRVKKKNKY